MSVKATKWAYDLFEVIDIPPQERAILLAICWHHHAKTGACFPSNETLSRMTGYRKQRVIEGTKKLCLWGLIKKRPRRNGNRQSSNEFTLFGSFSGSPRKYPQKPVSGYKKKDPESGYGWGDTIGGHNTRGDEDENVIEFPSQKVGGSNA